MGTFSGLTGFSNLAVVGLPAAAFFLRVIDKTSVLP
jgi:hypothetical protein